MRLSPDQWIFWQHGFVKLNATIVFTWALMLVLVAGSALVTRRLGTGRRLSRWQCLLEIVVTGIAGQIKEVGLGEPNKYLAFIGTLFVFVAASALCTPCCRASSRRPVRCRPRPPWRCACSWPCLSTALRARACAATSSRTWSPPS